MVTVKVTDEDMVDPMNADSIFRQLELSTFAAINQDVMTLNGKVLTRREPAVGRKCAAGTQDGDLEVS